MRAGMFLAHRVWTLAAALLLAFIAAGCAPGAAPSPPSRHNGKILSKTLVAREAGFNIYRLMYWSRGYRVEAYLSLPTGHRRYPLVIDLHGGWITFGPHTDTYVWTKPLVESLAATNAVELFPEYRGYLGSSGLPGGLRTDTENVRDALTALASYSTVNLHRVYLLGYSMGGGVALTLAGELPDVRAVVAVSPYVGMKTVEAYWALHPPATGTHFARQLNGLELAYGMPPAKRTLRAESPDMAAITAPVLLLQGTGDVFVEWQTVQAFADGMRALHKTVKLILYPGGPHGLHTAPYGGESTAAMTAWFARYGLNILY